MFTRMKLKAFLQGTAPRFLIIACLISLGALTVNVVLSAVFRGASALAEKVPIGGEWKIMHGDAAEYSLTSFDDSGWQTVSLPSNTADPAGNPEAFQWLRKHVFIPADERGSFNAIRLGVIHAADEVYFNGVLIGSTGSMTDKRDINYDKIRVYALPPGIVAQGGWNVVAVRVRSAFPDIAGIFKGSLAVGNQIDFTAHDILWDIQLVIVIFILLFSGIIFIFIGIVRSRSESEYFLVSTFMLLMAIYIFLTTQLRFSINSDFILDKGVKFSILAMMLPFCMRFIYIILLAKDENGPVGKLSKGMDVLTKWFFIYPLIYGVVILITGDIRTWRSLDSMVNDKVIVVFLTVSVFIIVYMVAKGNRDALLLLGGLVLFAFTVLYDILVPEHSIHYTIGFSSFGVLALVLSMNLIVAYRFHKLTFSLGRANVEIAGHNRELEQQVREKTQSLVEANKRLEVNNRELLELNSQMKAAQAKLEKIASTDSLTGLYNRFEIDKRLKYQAHAIKRSGESRYEGFSILYIDIDNFKYINDTFGHQAGDLVLVSFAEILKSVTRQVDIVARYGGDEFIVLMPNTDYEGAKEAADRIAERLEKADSFRQYIQELKKHPVSIDDKYRLSGSYGIAVYQADETIDDMIKRADKALYAMKALKR